VATRYRAYRPVTEHAEGSVLQSGAVVAVDFEGYRRRVDAFEYRPKHRDTPSDIRELLELAREIEWTDKVIVDRADNDE
jgi:hypothetical protein